MIVLACGGRAFADRDLVFRTLDEYVDMGILIEGGASGADRLARSWAASRFVHCATVPAIWRRQGLAVDRAAGPKRNQAMLLLKPNIVIAFPGGAGTASMIRLAMANQIPVKEVG